MTRYQFTELFYKEEKRYPQSDEEKTIINAAVLASTFQACIFQPFCYATQAVILAAIVRAIGYSLMASLGALALATGVGALIVIPVVLGLLEFGPQPAPSAKEEWSLRDYAVITARRLLLISMPILSMLLGCAILGVTLNPAILVAAAIASSIMILATLAHFAWGAGKICCNNLSKEEEDTLNSEVNLTTSVYPETSYL